MGKMNKIKPEDLGMATCGETAGKKELYYPHLSFSEVDLPDIEKWNVGKDYSVVLKITMTGMQTRQGGEMRADFDIKEVGVYDSKEESSEPGE